MVEPDGVEPVFMLLFAEPSERGEANETPAWSTPPLFA